jgi:hypothetical protein
MGVQTEICLFRMNTGLATHALVLHKQRNPALLHSLQTICPQLAHW